MLYTIKKDGAIYLVLDSRGTIQFRSMARANCKDWIRANTPEDLSSQDNHS